MEKTASFHGHENFSACIRRDDDDEDAVLYTRLVNIMSHGAYSLYEPQVWYEENKTVEEAGKLTYGAIPGPGAGGAAQGL